MRTHAVVLGGGMAGLVAARVLVDHYERVTIIDRDELTTQETGPRRGVPQGRHINALIARGQQVLEELFPGLSGGLHRQGVPRLDQLADVAFHVNGHRLRQGPSGLEVLSASRPCLEYAVRERVLALPGVEVMSGTDIVGLITSTDKARVIGARAIRRTDGSAGSTVPADLVVDASGRGSRAGRWLEELGYGRPAEERVDVDLGYATAIFRLRPGALGSEQAIIIAPSPARPRGGGAAWIEGGRCLVTLAGMLGDHPPTDPEGFLEFARSITPSLLFDAIADSEPIERPVPFRFQASTRRHFERLARLPLGFAVLGDAVCSFNPLYGQGISVAALEAIVLDRHLERGGEPRPRELALDIAAVVDSPWKMAVGGDLAFPAVPGRRPMSLRVANRYLPRLHAVAEYDVEVSRAFVRVAGLVDPPEALLHPRILRRVFMGARRARVRSSADPVAPMAGAVV